MLQEDLDILKPSTKKSYYKQWINKKYTKLIL